MRPVFRTVIQPALAGGLACLALLFGSAAPGAQALSAQETTRSVRRALERLPHYGVFDFLAFGVDRGTVTLVGYTYGGSLKLDAERAARRASGVDEVANKLELLPASLEDDRIRRATFYRIYSNEFLSRYAPGGAVRARSETLRLFRFPGLQPFGKYGIHIVVKNGRTTLLGEVDSESDRQIAAVRAREVTGVFGVENELRVGK